MINQAAKSTAINALDRSVSDELFLFELVRALYSTPKSIHSATLVALTVVAISAVLSGDAFYGVVLAGFAIIGLWRSSALVLYHRGNHTAADTKATKRWELVALIGAWAFAALIGCTGAYTLLIHPGRDVEILIDCCVIGHIAGISARNASRPIITMGQISATCIPFAMGLLLRGDFVHITLATFIGLLFLSTMLTCRSVFENIAYRHFAYREIENLAQRDTLTQLWNRAAFLHLFEERLQTTLGADKVVALMAIDLDQFKEINDTLGHPAGDAILKQTADRLRDIVRPGDEVARIGGDEFLIMFTGADAAEIEAVAQRILSKFSGPFLVNMTESVCGASVGYAVSPKDGSTLDEMLRNADLALYAAKKRGRCQAVAYDVALSVVYNDRVALESDLQFALDRGELELVYQPIVDPRSGRAICCEALLRWHHPTRGSISPSVFIPIAEATGLIIPIGTWVLDSACKEAMNWGVDINVAVNLSPVQFRRGREIVDVAMKALADSGLAARRLELEVTESVLIEDSAATSRHYRRTPQQEYRRVAG